SSTIASTVATHRQRGEAASNRQPTTREAPIMKRETIIFTACGFLLGLTIGSLVIGPKVAQSKLAGASQPQEAVSEAPPQAATGGNPAAAGGSPMAAVQQQLAALKDVIAKDPNNFDALVQ